MSNSYRSISERLATLNIDIYHYEDIVRCYSLAKLNIKHSEHSDYADGIHAAEFDAVASQFQLLSPNVKRFCDNSAFFSLYSELADCFLNPSCPSRLPTGIGLCLYSPKDITKDWPMCFT